MSPVSSGEMGCSSQVEGEEGESSMSADIEAINAAAIAQACGESLANNGEEIPVTMMNWAGKTFTVLISSLSPNHVKCRPTA